MFKSFLTVATLCLPDHSLTEFSAPKFLKTASSISKIFPTLTKALGVLLAPSPFTASLQTLFRCSMNKSQGILHADKPHKLINQPQIIVYAAPRKGSDTEPTM